MKKYTIILALSLIFFSSLSCKDNYLDVEPIDRYGVSNFPKNESQIEQAVIALYRKTHTTVNDFIWVWGDFLSDNTSFRYNPTDRGGVTTEQLDEFVATPDNGNFNNLFRESMDAIQRSNLILENLSKVSFANSATADIKEGEAKFFRAWNYFNLVRVYGDVPVVLNNIVSTDPKIAEVYPRVPVAEVFSKVIIPDALAAVAKLPKTTTAAQKGRLTSAAASMLLAKSYMAQNNFKEAASTLQAVIGGGFTLASDYAAVFDPTKKNGSESIFEIQSDPVLGYSFSFMNSWTPWGTGVTIWPGSSNSRGGLNQPTADLNAAYDATDKRKAVVIGSTGTGAATILYMKKFLYWDALNKANPVNFPVYRYSDALLMMAECLNEEGFPNKDAFTYLNAVRTRAGLLAKTQGNAEKKLTIESQEELRLAIEQERRLELAGEGHRWFDLQRTNRAEAVMKAHGEAEKKLKATVDKAAYTNIRKYAAYPPREIQQYGYPQTSGW